LSGGASEIEALIRLIETLRGENGCPWDKAQTPRTMMVYLLEEAYELSEAIASDDAESVCEELGDVLFQVLFIARLFAEAGEFDIRRAARLNREKMIRRHPHVFDTDRVEGVEHVLKRWQEIKKKEKSGAADDSVLDATPAGLPPLMQAFRIGERAARAGFEPDDSRTSAEEIDRIWCELKSCLAEEGEGLSELIGDLFFSLVNLTRQSGLHPENALVGAIHRFRQRFVALEKERGSGID
jgi:tetrapyrrole methylase family protein / MazG family protein